MAECSFCLLLSLNYNPFYFLYSIPFFFLCVFEGFFLAFSFCFISVPMPFFVLAAWAFSSGLSLSLFVMKIYLAPFCCFSTVMAVQTVEDADCFKHFTAQKWRTARTIFYLYIVRFFIVILIKSSWVSMLSP